MEGQGWLLSDLLRMSPTRWIWFSASWGRKERNHGERAVKGSVARRMRSQYNILYTGVLEPRARVVKGR